MFKQSIFFILIGMRETSKLFFPHLILHGVFYFAIFKLRLFVFFTLGAAILKPKNDQFNEQK